MSKKICISALVALMPSSFTIHLASLTVITVQLITAIVFEGTEKKLTLLTSVTAKGNECALRHTQVAEAASGLSCRATAPLTGTGELSKD